MKKIDKLNITFEKRKIPPRKDLEALHDKINECVKAINLMHGHYEPGDLPIHVDWDTLDPDDHIYFPSYNQKTGEKAIPTDSSIFGFEKINLAVLESGRYHVEKHRFRLIEIKVGYALQNEFNEWVRKYPCDVLQKVNNPRDVFHMEFCGAIITFPCVEETYYMKSNEILFISECDSIYARAIKK